MFRNCILITIDSLRADFLGCYGYKDIETPNIDELASQGIMFVNAYSNSPGTPSSFVAIFSSTYPLMFDGYNYFSEMRISVAEVLRDNGFLTIGVHSNPFLSRKFSYHRGFDVFYDDIYVTGVKSIKGKKFLNKGLKYISKVLGLASPYICGEKVNKIVKNIFDEKYKGQRFFLWIHYMDVHFPYTPHDTFSRIFKRRMVKYLNSLIERSKKEKNLEIKESDLEKLIEL